MAIAEPHDEGVRGEVAQAVAGEFLEAADEGLAVAVAGGKGVGAVFCTTRDGARCRIEQQADG